MNQFEEHLNQLAEEREMKLAEEQTLQEIALRVEDCNSRLQSVLERMFNSLQENQASFQSSLFSTFESSFSGLNTSYERLRERVERRTATVSKHGPGLYTVLSFLSHAQNEELSQN